MFFEKSQGQVNAGNEGTLPVFYSLQCAFSLSVQQPSEVAVIIPTLQMKKLRLRKGKCLPEAGQRERTEPVLP